MGVREWVEARLPTDRVHLDAAACGRLSRAALAAEVAHLQAEADGGYLAEADAEPVLAAGRSALGAMVGLAGTDVAFTEGAGTAFVTMLSCWPLPAGSRIGTVSSEYGANARLLAQLAALRGWTLVPLPVDGLGRFTSMPTDLDLVTFPHIASQRGVVQPAADVLATGVPLLLDVAQSLGQSAVPAGAAAYVGTSRKWLCGPRGVGFAVVDPQWLPRLTDPPTLGPAHHGPGVRRLESQEAHVAGRVGLAVAAQEWTPQVVAVGHDRAAQARALLDGVDGWQVVEPVDEPSAMTTLRGGDPVATRARLLAGGFVVSAVPRSRAADLDGAVLRVSTPAWVTEQDVEALARALPRRTSVGSAP